MGIPQWFSSWKIQSINGWNGVPPWLRKPPFLVGGDWNHGILWLSIYWEGHHPKWRTPSFFRGVGQAPTSYHWVIVQDNRYLLDMMINEYWRIDNHWLWYRVIVCYCQGCGDDDWIIGSLRILVINDYPWSLAISKSDIDIGWCRVMAIYLQDNNLYVRLIYHYIHVYILIS